MLPHFTTRSPPLSSSGEMSEHDRRGGGGGPLHGAGTSRVAQAGPVYRRRGGGGDRIYREGAALVAETGAAPRGTRGRADRSLPSHRPVLWRYTGKDHCIIWWTGSEDVHCTLRSRQCGGGYLTLYETTGRGHTSLYQRPGGDNPVLRQR